MNEPNNPRRRFLIGATSITAGAGLIGIGTPFIGSWNPSAKAEAGGAPVRVDVSRIEPGALVTVEWRGKPVWVLRRTKQNLKTLRKPSLRQELSDPDSEIDQQPEYAKNEFRSIREDILVAMAICTHLGCIPGYHPEGRGDIEHALYFCPCHGSKFDLAGRVFKNVPAPTNLVIPPYRYPEKDELLIGEDAPIG